MNPGEILDNRYEIIERLGAGGMGEVYKAVHTHLGAIRVIKVVHPQISGNIDAADRFLREGRAATRIHHPNVATLHDFSSLPNGSHYMVWEYIDGENLAQRLRSKGILQPRQAVHLIIQALHGLEAIHRAGIVHRDISPENLMVTKESGEDNVKIIDLGVAKVEDSEVSQTRTGIFVGKLRYAAPEQLGFLPEGEKVDARVDIYATAMVLVELLTGRPPYEAKSPHEYFILHASQAPLKTVELPVDLPGSAPLQEVLEKALARDRNQRYSTAREFAQALEGIERTLTDAHDTATIMTPIGGADRTIQQTTPDTLHRKTAVTGAGMTPPPAPIPAPPTVANTPRPFMSGDAAPTVLTPLPEASFPQQAPKQGSMLPLILVIGVVLLFVGGGVGLVMFWPFGKKPAVAENTTTATSTAPVTTTQSGKVAEASVTVTTPPDVTATTATVPTATIVETQTAPPVTTTTAPPVKTTTREESRPKVVVAEKPPAEDDTPRDSGTDVDAAPRDGFSSGWVYVDGGDSDRNDRALAALRRELRGTRQVALRAGGMQMEVVRALRADFPNLEFVPYADVVIRFEGTLERRGRAGLKRRAAEATVSKNGRIIFRYQLPGEDYRVGDSPAESFARVLANAMNEE